VISQLLAFLAVSAVVICTPTPAAQVSRPAKLCRSFTKRPGFVEADAASSNLGCGRVQTVDAHVSLTP
jgi:hypothetical protein